MIKKYEKKLFVGLGSTYDLSRFVSFSQNEIFEEIQKPDSLVYFEVNSLNEARHLVQNFISYFNLTASNYIGGKVIDNSLNFIATISYNGRIWDNDDWKIAKEIELC